MGITDRVAALCADLRWTPDKLRCRCRTDEYVAYRIVVARALHIEGYNAAEIGGAIGRSRATVRYYVYRAELPGDERR